MGSHTNKSLLQEESYCNYSVILLLDNLRKAFQAILCPVCKQNSIHLECLQNSEANYQTVDNTDDSIIVKCNSCVAPIFIFDCILKKELLQSFQPEVSFFYFKELLTLFHNFICSS